MASFTDLDQLIGTIRRVDAQAADDARARHDQLAKPPGSLGRLEALGAQLAAIAGRCPPPVPTTPALVVAAGDHGVHAEGVTPWPQAVTRLVVDTLARDGAAANVLARVVGARLAVLDVGTAGDPRHHDAVIQARVRAGTANLAREPAMSRTEAHAAILAGAHTAARLVDDGADLLVTGEVGIANTTAAACLIAALTAADPRAVTGRGAGIDDATLARKRQVVAHALARHGPDRAPLTVLASLGGLEHAALTGLILAGAASRVPVLLDGVSADAAALVAVALAPGAAGVLIAGHASTEPGAMIALERLGVPPLLDLGLRLGEGTGALLAVPVVQAAARVLSDMATLAEIGVTPFDGPGTDAPAVASWSS